MNTPRGGASAVSLGNYIYVFGGKTNNNIVLNTVERFNPATGVWDSNTVPPLNYARYNSAAAVFNNEIYVTGGRNNNAVLDVVEVYNPAQNAWRTVNDMRNVREGHSAVVFNDTLFVIGGMKDQSHYEEEIEWYDINQDKWEKRDSSFISPRAAAFVNVFGNHIYVCGGVYYGLLADSYIADQAFNWTIGPNMLTGRSYGGAAVSEDKLYMIGGEITSGVSAKVEFYEPWSWSINSGPDLSMPRSGLTAVTFNDTIYALGGWSENHTQILSVVEYMPPTAVGIDERPARTVPQDYAVISGYPNPFNGVITLEVSMPTRGDAELKIYDLQGRLISTLYKGNLSSGIHSFTWEAANRNKNQVASGIYMALLKTANNIDKLKVIYVR